MAARQSSPRAVSPVALRVRPRPVDEGHDAIADGLRRIGRNATLALYRELALAPKPGLVTLQGSGSHEDMDANTFMRSIFALRTYFPAIAAAGARTASFAELEQLGINAETRMLAATAGINTHRGAIFALGLLCAAAGRLVALGRPVGAEAIRRALEANWGDALRERAARSAAAPAHSKGQRVARQWRLRSAGEEAAESFPVLFNVTFPALKAALALAGSADAALEHALFATIAALDDTNLAHRGGIDGLRFAQSQAQEFLEAGSVFREKWRMHAGTIHERFVARRLSPGGAADMLACAWWLGRVSSA
jgi:triphosphoribosyl-dephospho-CoA synthase